MCPGGRRVITVSQQHSKQDIVDFFRLPADKVSVIHEAADPLFDRLPTEEAVRHVTGRYGIPRPYLLYVGGWERRKNAHFLVRAFERGRPTSRVRQEAVQTRSPMSRRWRS